MFNNDPIDPNFDSEIELIQQELEYVNSLKKNSEKLINAIADDKFITVGEARRMSRLSIDISQFPAIQKVFDVIADSNILSSNSIENEDEMAEDFEDYDDISEDNMPDENQTTTAQKQKRIKRRQKKLNENLSKNSSGKYTDEDSAVCADDLFGMINDIAKNNVIKNTEPAPQRPSVEQTVNFDPYNREMNDYDIDELTEDIPTFDIDSGYKLHNL